MKKFAKIFVSVVMLFVMAFTFAEPEVTEADGVGVGTPSVEVPSLQPASTSSISNNAAAKAIVFFIT